MDQEELMALFLKTGLPQAYTLSRAVGAQREKERTEGEERGGR